MKQAFSLLCLCVLVVTAGMAQEQGDVIGIPLGKPAADATAFTALTATTCAAVPTTAPSSFNQYYYLDTDVASKLGIQWIGSATGSGELKQVVLVRELRRFGSCDATDGSGVIQYGQALRATVLVTSADLSAGLNFAIVAASATLRKQSASVMIENTGFSNPDVDSSAQKAMQDVAATGLTVVSFAKFSEDIEKAFAAATTSALASPYSKLAYVPNVDTASISTSVASTFAVACMAKGWACVDAKRMFPGQNAATDGAIERVYQTLTGACANVSDIQKANAQTLLAGMNIKPGCHN